MNRQRTREGDQVFWSVWGEGSCPSIKAYEGVQPPSLCPAGRGCLVSAISFLPGAEGIAWSTSVGHLPRRCFHPRGPRCGTHLQKVVV